jgi:hypothetical protein
MIVLISWLLVILLSQISFYELIHLLFFFASCELVARNDMRSTELYLSEAKSLIFWFKCSCSSWKLFSLTVFMLKYVNWLWARPASASYQTQSRFGSWWR